MSNRLSINKNALYYTRISYFLTILSMSGITPFASGALRKQSRHFFDLLPTMTAKTKLYFSMGINTLTPSEYKLLTSFLLTTAAPTLLACLMLPIWGAFYDNTHHRRLLIARAWVGFLIGSVMMIQTQNEYLYIAGLLIQVTLGGILPMLQAAHPTLSHLVRLEIFHKIALALSFLISMGIFMLRHAPLWKLSSSFLIIGTQALGLLCLPKTLPRPLSHKQHIFPYALYFLFAIAFFIGATDVGIWKSLFPKSPAWTAILLAAIPTVSCALSMRHWARSPKLHALYKKKQTMPMVWTLLLLASLTALQSKLNHMALFIPTRILMGYFEAWFLLLFFGLLTKKDRSQALTWSILESLQRFSMLIGLIISSTCHIFKYQHFWWSGALYFIAACIMLLLSDLKSLTRNHLIASTQARV